jgi:hypothetical protein
MLLKTIFMGTTGNDFLQLTDVQHIKVLLVKVKTLHAECFPSDCRQQCEHYYYTLYSSTSLTDKNPKHTYLVKEDATIPRSLVSHQQHSLNNAQKCELLWHLAAKRCWLSHTRQVFKEWCQYMQSSDIPLLKRQKVCGLTNSTNVFLWPEAQLPIKLKKIFSVFMLMNVANV